VSAKSFWGVLLGAILFGISDNILGYFKFNNIANAYSQVAVMITYYASQYLLTNFILEGMQECKVKEE
jgi:hypothetical protein